MTPTLLCTVEYRIAVDVHPGAHALLDELIWKLPPPLSVLYFHTHTTIINICLARNMSVFLYSVLSVEILPFDLKDSQDI